MSINLQEFFADARIELAQTIRQRGIDSEGIDIFGVYCLHTGKKIGEFTSDTILDALADEATEDESDLLDAMLVRCVASMRPSPALNKPDIATIQMMVEKRPIEALSYLLNRLYGNKRLLTTRSEDAFAPLFMRIKTHAKLSQFETSHVGLIHWLLELDSKMNLHELSPPMFDHAAAGKWTTTKLGMSLIEALNTIDEVGLLACFESWVFKHLAEFDKRDSQATREAAWLRGNTMTKRAYVRSWLDNPEIANRKQAEVHAKSKLPVRVKSEKTQKLNAEVENVLGMLERILNGEIANEPIIVTPKPKLRLAGSLFQKKEPNS